MSVYKISSETTALVIGAGHGIGLEVVRALKEHYQVKVVHATYRQEALAGELLALDGVDTHQVDPTISSEVESLTQSEWIKELDLIFITVGAVTFDHQGPEKSIRNFDINFALENFKVNSLVCPLWAKFLLPKLSRTKAISWATLSAKVGSIGDNSLGGWYSYRASKAALNMYLTTLAIEALRGKYQIQFFSLHPGTVATTLSEPYRANVKHEVFEPKDCAQMLLNQVTGWNEAGPLKFVDYKGEVLPW